MSQCPICQGECDERLLAQSIALQPVVARLVATYHTDWRPKAGICPSCAAQYAAKIADGRAPYSYHTTDTPHGSFPYYHRWEESVYSQAERLPDYTSFSGEGVTVAFLDSGYYPHPDLLTTAVCEVPIPLLELLSAEQWQALLQSKALRLTEYVDLTDGGERVGLTQPTLWDSAGDSWHGQMTTTVVAGNGLLSGGRYRGYAPTATILPIKIGRSGGRIPETDILRGLEWLLRDDNWARYQVRVLNISVGGDLNQPWQENPVARAAEALIARGVFIAAAAGNSGREELRAPASAPSVLTVGGVDDGNRPWSIHESAARTNLYHHNYGVVAPTEKAPTDGWRSELRQPQRLQSKPELVALAQWLPAPILPVSAIFREVATIGELRRLLLGYDPLRNDDLGWLASSPMTEEIACFQPPDWMPELWRGLRERMNAHKWIHPYYQHVDGTSVSVAQVSAVAAQMVAANPNLNPVQIRAILLESALPLQGQPHHLTGYGLLQPRKAVALAMRSGNGPLAGLPLSGTILSSTEALTWQIPQWHVQSNKFSQPPVRIVYLGCYAPEATAVTLIGDFNDWQFDTYRLAPTDHGWWHGALALPPGRYAYRFWVEKRRATDGNWQPDYEHAATIPSGYDVAHSLLEVVS